jgi:hypothetical protein
MHLCLISFVSFIISVAAQLVSLRTIAITMLAISQGIRLCTEIRRPDQIIINPHLQLNQIVN